MKRLRGNVDKYPLLVIFRQAMYEGSHQKMERV